MKELIAITALIFSLLSFCKEIAKPIASPGEPASGNTTKIKHFDSVWNQQFNFKVYDSCTGENIDMSGLETYKLKTVGPTNTFYYIYYEIDLTGITGVGEKSGTTYTGGGFNKGMTKAKWKFSHLDTTWNDRGPGYILDSIFVNTLTVGKEVSNIKYKSIHDEITFNVKNVFKQVNGVTVIDDAGKPVLIACKEY